MLFTSFVVGAVTYWSVARSDGYVPSSTDVAAAYATAEHQAIVRLHTPGTPSLCAKASDLVVIETEAKGESVASMVPGVAIKLLPRPGGRAAFVDGRAKQVRSADDGRFVTYEVSYRPFDLLSNSSPLGNSRMASVIATPCADGTMAFTQVRGGE